MKKDMTNEKENLDVKRAITSRMESVEVSMQDLFTNLYCKKDFEVKLRKASVAQTDTQVSILRDVAQMLGDLGVKCDYGKPISYYAKLVSKLDIPVDAEAIDAKFIEALYKIYSEYPTPEDFMKRIVDSLASEGMLTESLRLRILKRFVSAVNVKENKKYYSKTFAGMNADELDESVFDALDVNGKNDCLPLLQAANNLAKGNFISPVTTKELLFLFAFAFDMRYYTDASSDYDVDRDVEKNLFEDYYCDNLMRYIYSEDGGKSGNSDKEPSGLGLHPKNFVDVVFIYYLNKPDMETPLKVSSFYTAINRIKDEWKDRYAYSEDREKEFVKIETKNFKTLLDEKLFDLSVDELDAYILDNYYCDVRYTYPVKNSDEIREGSRGVFELQFASVTADEQYGQIISLIKETLELDPKCDFSKLDFRKIKDVSDGDAFQNLYSDNKVLMRVCELEKNVPSSKMEELEALAASGQASEKFITIIKNIEKRLNPYDAIGITNPADLTRTKLISAYYHFYCLLNDWDEGASDWTSFEELFKDMSACLNTYLLEARYQPISPKNIYDVFVIFFAYCKINNFLIDANERN